MSIDKIWVLAEVADGSPTSTTLELLTEARSMGSTVAAVTWGGEAASVAGDARRLRGHHRLRRRATSPTLSPAPRSPPPSPPSSRRATVPTSS